MKKAFTLIELLVVIAIVGLLSALLLPAVSRAKASAERALCTSNQRQWGIALKLYADDNGDYFPPNTDAPDIVYHGTNIQLFWRDYLIPWRESKLKKARNHVLYCPTDKLHRDVEINQKLTEADKLYGGYILLPHRRTESKVVNYNVTGVEKWLKRQKYGSEESAAPILADRLEPVINF